MAMAPPENAALQWVNVEWLIWLAPPDLSK
jgi:hypothetical protein